MAQEQTRIETRLAALKEQQDQQTQQTALRTTVEEFCGHIQTALHTPYFETKQKILRLVVKRIVVTDEQVTIHHMIPLPDVRLQRRQYRCRGPTGNTKQTYPQEQSSLLDPEVRGGLSC
jgi:hypothetical protein